MIVAPEIISDLASDDAHARDHARAHLGQLKEVREWDALFRSLPASLPERAQAVLRQECLDFWLRARPSPHAWVEFVARALTSPSPLSTTPRAMQEFVASILESASAQVPVSAQREFVEQVLARGARKGAAPSPLVRLMVRVARGMSIREARPYLLEMLAQPAGALAPELVIDLLQALGRVGRPEDIPALALHLQSDSPGIAQSAFDAIVALSDDLYALRSLLMDPTADAERRDALRSALVHTRFALPSWLIHRIFAWVLRFERGPRTRASLIEVIARRGGSAAAGVLITTLQNTRPQAQSREEREKLRSALTALRTPDLHSARRVWKRAARANDPFLQTLGWQRLAREPAGARIAFSEARRRWARLSLYSRLACLEAAREIVAPAARKFLEEVARREEGVTQRMAWQALAARADVDVLQVVGAIGAEGGRGDLLTELAENPAATAHPALAELCLREIPGDSALVYAQVRAQLRQGKPAPIAHAISRISRAQGCLRERLQELLLESIAQESIPWAELPIETYADPAVDRLLRELLAQAAAAGAWSDRQWEGLLRASPRSAAVREFLAGPGDGPAQFWRTGIRSIVGGFMPRERWRELKQAIGAFAAIPGAGAPSMDAIQAEMARRESQGGSA